MLTLISLLQAAKGEAITFLAYDLGFNMFIEILTAISRAFRLTINMYVWLVISKFFEDSERAIQLFRDTRDKVGVYR